MTGIWIFTGTLGVILLITLIFFTTLFFGKKDTTTVTPSAAAKTAKPSGSTGTATFFKFALGTLMAGGVFLILIMVLISIIEYYKDLPSRSAVVAKSPEVSPEFPLRAEIQETAYVFWNRNVPLVDAWKMFRVIEQESGFRQYNDDGTVLVGIEDKDDIGVHQINRRVNAERIRKLGFDPYTMEGDQKYNIYLPEGNFNVALAFFKERGFKDWQKTVDLLEEEVKETYIAPVGEWGEVHKIRANCQMYGDRPMKIMDDKGVVHEYVPGKVITIRTWTFQLSVPDEPVGNMDYICSHS